MVSPDRRHLSNRAARRLDTLSALAVAAAELTDGADGRASFADLSIERLARRAGISRATFYLYFEDRVDVVRGWLEAFDKEADRVLDSWWSAGHPTPDLLSTCLGDLESLHRENRFILSAAEEMTASDLILRREREDAFRQRKAALHRHISSGQRGGWVDSSLAAEATASWLVAMLDRVMQHVVPTQTQGFQLTPAGADIIWRTLYAIDS